MSQATAFRGQPLLLLAAVLLAWVGMRAALWRPVFEQEARASADPEASTALERPALAVRADRVDRGPPLPSLERLREPAGAAVLPGRALSIARRDAVFHGAGPAPSGLAFVPLDSARAQQTPAPGIPAAAPSLGAARPAGADQHSSRWFGDAWLMLRHDTTSPVLSGHPSYGRSQVGAILRYRLAGPSGHVPQVHLRASSALAGAREQELAVGLSARPLAGVPVRVAIEGRASETAAGLELRPAAFAVTELPPADLPFSARGEIYLQAGYVGGRFETAFIDGQARIDRSVLDIPGAELRIGGAAWGGAQEDAARLDVGPSASVEFQLGRAYGRLSADYRLRVAGDAEPSSGPAVTVSAGF